MKPDICVYHSPCLDGFTAAWAVWRRFGHHTMYVPANHGDAPPDVKGHHVLIVDFSYPKAVLEEMAKTAASVTILDHHKSAQADLSDYSLRGPFTWQDELWLLIGSPPGKADNIRALFDMKKSGARLAWEFCFPDREAPQLVRYVEDRDLWRFDLDNSRAVAAWLYSLDYGFEQWDRAKDVLAGPNSSRTAIAEGEAILRKQAKDIAEILDLTMRYMLIAGERVPVANLPYTLASEAGNILAEGNAFAATYFDRADGARLFSLRSLPGGADVSEIAKVYGGGGHRHAAGFRAPPGWEGEDSRGTHAGPGAAA